MSSIFHATLTELELATYYEAVSSLSNEQWVYSVNRACAESQRFPRPADIREIAKAHRLPAPQITHTSKPGCHYTAAYNRDRSQLCMDIVFDRLGPQQIAERLWGLIDAHPRYATELDKEAAEYWRRR